VLILVLDQLELLTLLLELLELELVLWLELDSLELLELELVLWLELELDWLELLLELWLELLLELDWLLELELDWLELLELLVSSIERIRNRSSVRGPGNSKSPVWKFNTSGSLVPPPAVNVSTKTACQISFLGMNWVVLSVAPARVALTCKAGAVSSPALEILRTVRSLLAKPTA
jgi:hypothetical protein